MFTQNMAQSSRPDKNGTSQRTTFARLCFVETMRDYFISIFYPKKTAATSPTSPTCAIARLWRHARRSVREVQIAKQAGSRRLWPVASRSLSLATDQSSTNLQLDGSLL